MRYFYCLLSSRSSKIWFCTCGMTNRRKKEVFPTRKNCLFFLTGLKMVVGVGFCKIKVDSNFLLVLKIKCTKFHQDRSKTVDLHTKYTNKQTFSFIYVYRFRSTSRDILERMKLGCLPRARVRNPSGHSNEPSFLEISQEIVHFRWERGRHSHLRPVRLVEWPGPDSLPADLHEFSRGLHQRQLQQPGSPGGRRCRLVTSPVVIVEYRTRSINKGKQWSL
jgi:hypothetical protein